MVDLCLERQAQALIIAGDLFEVRRPARATVDFALAQLQRLGEATPAVQVFLLPGTHDCWAEGAVYDTPPLRSLPQHIHVLGGPEPVAVSIPHLGLAVHGVPHQCDLGAQQPLRDLRPSPDAAINVGVAHGSIERGDIEGDSSMFATADIDATGLDYLALGHWHSWHDHSSASVPAINPGSPEVPGFGSWQQGVVAEVVLGEGPARVAKLPVGTLTAATLKVEVGELGGTGDLIQRLAERADGRHLLDVTLTGLAAPGVVVDMQEAMQELAGGFFALRIRDQSHPVLEDIDTGDVPEALVLGRFIQLAREQIEAAVEERNRRVAERALQLGVALLRGEDVL